MHEELNQFVRNDVWELVPRLENVHVVRTYVIHLLGIYVTILCNWLIL